MEEEDESNQNLGKLTEKKATDNNKPALQSSQSQTTKLVSDSDELDETFTKMKDNKNFFKVIRDPESNYSGNGYDIIALGGNRVKFNAEDFDSNPEIQTASTDMRYVFIKVEMIDDQALSCTKILESVKNDRTKYSISKRTKSVKIDITKRSDKIRILPLHLPPINNEEKSEEKDSNDLEGEGMKIIMPSNTVDFLLD